MCIRSQCCVTLLTLQASASCRHELSGLGASTDNHGPEMSKVLIRCHLALEVEVSDFL